MTGDGQLRETLKQICRLAAQLEADLGPPPRLHRHDLSVVDGRRWRRATPRRYGHLRAVQ